MKIVPPKPFTFEAGKRAVLLLHGFTGNTADVRMLGRYLQEQGYTCHAPLYTGHGVPPENILEASVTDWWQDAREGYNLLKEGGHDEIAVCGLSLGGVFSLKLGYTVPVKGIVPMCAPVIVKTEQKMQDGLYQYAKEYKQYEGKSEEQIGQEMDAFQKTPSNALKSIQKLEQDVYSNIDLIYAPTFVVQARHDEMIDTNSANMIYEGVESLDKSIKWYEHSTHVITFGEEKKQLHEDIYDFLEGLDWSY